jgi:hypothetical protein
VFFAALIISNRISATVTGRGEFYCLYCKAEQGYEQRRWQRTAHLFRFLPVGGSFGEFVICLSCGNTYDPECLDESSTAELEELLVEPPYQVTDVAGLGSGRARGATTKRLGSEGQLSGYSPGRKH